MYYFWTNTAFRRAIFYFKDEKRHYTLGLKEINSLETALPKNSMSLSNIASTTGEILKPLAKPLTQVKRSYKYKSYMTHNESY
jgi:hypothetical protein